MSPHASQMLDNLSVVAVDNIERQVNLKDNSSSRVAKSNSTAYLELKTKPAFTPTLYYVPADLDWFDVSTCLVPCLVDHPTPDLVIVLETMLKSNLWELQRKGFNTTELLRRFEDDEEQFEDFGHDVEHEKAKAMTQTRVVAAPTTTAAPPVKKTGFMARLFQSSSNSNSKQKESTSKSAKLPPSYYYPDEKQSLSM